MLTHGDSLLIVKIEIERRSWRWCVRLARCSHKLKTVRRDQQDPACANKDGQLFFHHLSQLRIG
jgi:hypothetical protein